jgi:2-oxoisovalerate dehydrogenase E1 component alpha subunit
MNPILRAIASRVRDCAMMQDERKGHQMTGYGPLKLHVPEPAVRPGGTPEFSSVRIPRAGSVARPSVDADPEAIRDLAYSIIRVLNPDGEAVGPWAGLLSDEALLAGLRDMMTLRVFDARMLMAQRQGKTSFYMQHMGEEAVSCAFRKALSPGDMNFPTYRQAGLLIAAGHSLVDMMCQIYSNEQDPLKGRQMPVLYSSKKDGFFSVSGNLATQYIQAVGWAMASAIKGDTRIAAGWIGDGSTAESDFHAALVFASTYKAPVVQPPMAPSEVIVMVEPESSSRVAVPVRAASASRATSAAQPHRSSDSA